MVFQDIKTRTTSFVIPIVLSAYFVFFFLLCSTKAPWGGQRVLAQEYFPWFGIAAGTLIFSIVAVRQTLIDRILSSVVLRAVGLV